MCCWLIEAFLNAEACVLDCNWLVNCCVQMYVILHLIGWLILHLQLAGWLLCADVCYTASDWLTDRTLEADWLTVVCRCMLHCVWLVGWSHTCSWLIDCCVQMYVTLHLIGWLILHLRLIGWLLCSDVCYIDGRWNWCIMGRLRGCFVYHDSCCQRLKSVSVRSYSFVNYWQF